MFHPRKLLALSLVAVVAVALAACGGEATETTSIQPTPKADEAASRSIRGKVIEVNTAPDGDKTESILVEVDGQELTFLLGENIDQNAWTPSHLKGHMFFGSSIQVEYIQEDSGLVAVGLND